VELTQQNRQGREEIVIAGDDQAVAGLQMRPNNIDDRSASIVRSCKRAGTSTVSGRESDVLLPARERSCPGKQPVGNRHLVFTTSATLTSHGLPSVRGL
jgi:hypothetical protein